MYSISQHQQSEDYKTTPHPNIYVPKCLGSEVSKVLCVLTPKDKNSAISKWLMLFFGLSLLPSDAAESLHSHLNADIKTLRPKILCVCSIAHTSTYVLNGSLAFTRAPSRTRSHKPAQLLQFLPRCMQCRRGLAIRILSVRAL